MLTITKASSSRHSGAYECSPDNIKPARIKLHVIEGEEEEKTLLKFTWKPFLI
jgi:hypothetical protein